MLKKAAEMFPKRIGCSYEFDYNLPHLVFSGSDAIMIPSKYEPCGIVQMQAMRYGSIPIARKTGGLANTIKNFHPEKEEGDGFLFKEYDPMALLAAICRAHTSYFFKNDWEKLIRRAMAKDFSWERSAKEYIKAFQAVLA